MFDIVAFGELLIDFYQTDEETFKKQAGGAPCNVLVAGANLGKKTAFIGKVGNDTLGKFLKKTIEDKNVNTDGLILCNETNTTLAFVNLDENGERSFSFYRKNSADVTIRNEDVNYNLIDNTKIMYFGSLAFTDEPCRSTILNILDYAKSLNKIIAYDVNYRSHLWEGKDNILSNLKVGLEYTNILKVSDEEALLLTNEKDLQKSSKQLLVNNVKVVLITLGENGVFYRTKDSFGIVESFKTKVVDTTGAGDAFYGAFLTYLLEESIDLNNIDNQKLQKIIRKANLVASINISKVGAMSGMPTKKEIDLLIEKIN